MFNLVLMTAWLAVGQPPTATPAAQAGDPLDAPDCVSLLAGQPAPGVVALCEAEDALRRASGQPAGSAERAALWRAAADRYRQAAQSAPGTAHRVYALEMVVRLHGPGRLEEPQAVEYALRALTAVQHTYRPLLRLGLFLEQQKRFEDAEQTLHGARQQYSDSLELLREMSKFYARRVLALTAGATPESTAEPTAIVSDASSPGDDAGYRPDCQQTTFRAPGPGAGDLCQAEALMRKAAPLAKSRPERKELLQAAAASYARATTALRDTEPKIYAYDALARVYSAAYLADPEAAEPAVRELIALAPGAVGPVLRLAALQEEQKLVNVAEATMLGARQQFPADLEVLRAFSRFYARLASAASIAAMRAERAAEPPIPPNQPDADGYYRVGSDVKVPKKLEERSASYPDEAKAVGLEGIVIVEIWVDETGRVTNARLLRGLPMLEEVALRAVRQWRFAPAVVDGRTVPVRMIVTHNFTLKR